MSTLPRVPETTWNPKDALASLVFEVDSDQGNVAATTARLLRESAPIAAASISHIAVHSQNDRTRMQAASFIVEKTLEEQLNHDIKLQQEQTRLVGRAVQMLVRSLAIKYNFDWESPDVRVLAHEALIAASSESLRPVSPPQDDSDEL